MKQQESEQVSKIRSPHPALQSVLPRLRALNPGRNETRPIFDNRAKAKLFIDIQEHEEHDALLLTPVWAIDHTDLTASQIRGWTVARYCN